MSQGKPGSVPVHSLRVDYAVTAVGTGAWVEIEDSMPRNCNRVEIYDSGVAAAVAQDMRLGYGPSGSEQDALRIVPGGNGFVPLLLNEGMRLVVRAVSAQPTSGTLILNFYK